MEKQLNELDLSQLCIIPGQNVWHLYVDVLITEHGGSIFDAISIAALAAFQTTRIPNTILQENENVMDFTLDSETKPLIGVDKLPTCVTINKIGRGFVVDATVQEEECAETKLHVFVRNEAICGIYKAGDGALEPSLLLAMLQSAITAK